MNKTCPAIFDLARMYKGGDFAVRYYEKAGPIFGGGHDIFIRDECDRENELFDEHYDEDDEALNPFSYCFVTTYDAPTNGPLCGGYSNNDEGPYYFKVIDYEVFQSFNIWHG